MTVGVWISKLKAEEMECFDQLVEISIPAGLLGLTQYSLFYLKKNS